MKAETEIGVLLPQSKECLGLPEAGKTRKNTFLEGSRKHGPESVLLPM